MKTKNEDMQVASQPPFPVILDEFGYYFADDSTLRETLRDMPGVPGVRYQVDGDRVFVFDRLVSLVSAHGLGSDGKPDPAQVANLLPSAWMSGLEAVQAGVVPEPYELVPGCKLFRVRHKGFNAWLPGGHYSKHGADQVLADLLLGQVIAGEGEFEYRGQPMTLIEPYDISKLSFNLPLRVERDGVEPGHWAMPKFMVGLAPLDEATYAAIADAYAGWHADRAAMKRLALANADALWARMAEWKVADLNDQDSVVSDYLADDAIALRGHYPELGMLNDGSLCDLYGEFAEDCLMQRSWTPYRHEDFLFYLLGIGALSKTSDGEAIREAGYVVAAGLLHGRPLEDAARIAALASSHANVACSMALRARKAIQFLEAEANRDWRVGPRIVTMNDALRMARSTGFSVIPSTVEEQPSA